MIPFVIRPVLLVTGGRDFCEATTSTGQPRDREVYMAERVALGFTLDMINPSSILVGDADGADRWAVIWCDRRSIPYTRFAADWTKHQKRAGPIRNQTMVDRRPDAGVSFPGGFGTADCVKRMNAAHIPVYETAIK